MVSIEEIQAVYYMVAATGVLVAAAYYVLNMRAQNINREAQLFMNIANQSFNNPDWLKAWRLVCCTKWSSAKEFMELQAYPNESEFGEAYTIIGAFFESLGVFVKEGLIDIRLVALLLTGFVKPFFEMVIPYLPEVRADLRMPRFLSETEYLYHELVGYIEKHPEIVT